MWQFAVLQTQSFFEICGLADQSFIADLKLSKIRKYIIFLSNKMPSVLEQFCGWVQGEMLIAQCSMLSHTCEVRGCVNMEKIQ
jgi:hypothetical protein